MKKARVRKAKFPAHQTWLIKTLAKGYADRVFILGVIGDIAKLIRQRRNQKRGASNTTCITCGGWISAERDDRLAGKAAGGDRLGNRISARRDGEGRSASMR